MADILKEEKKKSDEIFRNRSKEATYTNMMGIILFTIYSKGSDEYWENTEIKNGEGCIAAKNQKIKSFCGNELNAILEEAKKRFESTSEKQKEKIVENIKADPEGFLKSKTFKDLRKDLGINED